MREIPKSVLSSPHTFTPTLCFPAPSPFWTNEDKDRNTRPNSWGGSAEEEIFLQVSIGTGKIQAAGGTTHSSRQLQGCWRNGRNREVSVVERSQCLEGWDWVRDVAALLLGTELVTSGRQVEGHGRKENAPCIFWSIWFPHLMGMGVLHHQTAFENGLESRYLLKGKTGEGWHIYGDKGTSDSFHALQVYQAHYQQVHTVLRLSLSRCSHQERGVWCVPIIQNYFY